MYSIVVVTTYCTYLSPANRNPTASDGVLFLHQVLLNGFATIIIRLIPFEFAALLGHIRYLQWTLRLPRASCKVLQNCVKNEYWNRTKSTENQSQTKYLLHMNTSMHTHWHLQRITSSTSASSLPCLFVAIIL